MIGKEFKFEIEQNFDFAISKEYLNMQFVP